ncbi:MAG: Stp1/IreP family PP2C-type Ser/Thr phosphatase [Deltaproteobacteria bacterium]|nr:Stp1/IreP family PP2C-type Ser/Thr phosphatase [Deltaproteobacteria bacterium]
MKIHYAARTHLGKQRTNNEDNYFVLPEEHLYVVADGMGGHSSGEVASLLAVQALADFFIDTQGGGFADWPLDLDVDLPYDDKRLATAIKRANAKVHEVAATADRYHGMGTTIVSLSLGASGATLAHVGDSRAYLLRNGDIRQVTRDHSLLNETLKIRQLTPEEIKNFAHKNVIVRALGLMENVDVELTPLDPQPGDVYLLCSDGLSDMLEDAELLSVVDSSRDDLERAAQHLIEHANDNGGVDNITTILVGMTS